MNTPYPEDDRSPLGDLLESMPEETPPTGLQTRCVRALHEVAKAAPQTGWQAFLRTAAPVAACCMVVLVLGAVLFPTFSRAREKSHYVPRHEMSTPRYTPGPRGAMPEDAIPGAAMGTAPAGPPAAEEEARDYTRGPGAAGGMSGAPADSMKAEAEPRAAARPADYAADHAVTSPPPSDYAAEEAGPAKPWRDLSGERQKITTHEMVLEAKDVQDTYDRACGIITKADGVVMTQEIYMDHPGHETGHLFAQVPVDRVDGVVAQLRQLGKVVRLVGESDDRTREYRTRGAGIRDLGQQEVDLVARYEAETNRHRKQQLYAQIKELRTQNRGQKTVLKGLSERTHMAEIDLTIQRQSGPGAFLDSIVQNLGTTAAWIGVTAVLWIPVLVVIWFAARRRRG